MSKTNFERLEESINQKIDAQLGIDTMKGYYDSLAKEADTWYVVRPDGTVEFYR